MTTRILVVDDEPAVCRLMQSLLGSMGVDAETTTKSDYAAHILQCEKFDAVLVDSRMPTLSGLELVQSMRARGHNQKTPVVMITGDTDPKLLSQAFAAGANYFVSKPLCKKKLERVISAAACVIQKEKRRYQRIPVERPATITSGQQQFKGHTVDVSMGGVLVRTDDVHPIGTRAEMDVRLYPGAQPFHAKGRVVRLLEINLMGIEFEPLETRESEKLQDFLLPFLLNQFAGMTDHATQRAAVA